MELLESQGCGYVFGLSGNARPSKIGQPWCEDAPTRRALSGRQKIRRFFQAGYRAKSWPRERKVIARVEATSQGADIRLRHAYAAPLEPRPRPGVTNLSGKAKVLYEKAYCARGRMENMIKEHKRYTRSGRSWMRTAPSDGQSRGSLYRPHGDGKAHSAHQCRADHIVFPSQLRSIPVLHLE